MSAGPTAPALPIPGGELLGGARRLLRFAGPGLLVSVGYMDPGNWATDLAAGSRSGYALAWVVVGSSVAAMLLQHLAVKLGLVTGLDLAQATRIGLGRRVRLALWAFAELQIVACDVAEVLGAAMALQLLFGLPLAAGTAITILDVLVLLGLERAGARKLHAIVALLVATVFAGLGYQWLVARPDLHLLAAGLAPSRAVLEPRLALLAAGIVGATVMPHNLYLHSAAGRERARSGEPVRAAVRLATVDSTLSLALAMGVNLGLLCVSAAVFHGRAEVDDLRQASALLGPAVGSAAAGAVFAIALLAAGQSSALTGTMAGSVVMEGFLDLKLPAWKRRLLTRGLAVVPTGLALAIAGERAAGPLLILSQVLLALQLPFALVPLVRLTSSEAVMGRHRSSPLVRRAAWAVTAAVVALGLVVLVGAI